MSRMEVAVTNMDTELREICKNVIMSLIAAVERRNWCNIFYALPRFEVPLVGRGYTAWDLDGSEDINDLRQRMVKFLPKRIHL